MKAAMLLRVTSTLDLPNGYGNVPESWKKEEPMAKARIHVPLPCDSFEDDLSNDYESAAVPIAGSSSVAIEQRSLVDAGDEMPLTNHNDFIAQLTISSVVGNPLLIILVVVLMNMQETQVTSLTEEWLFRWRDAMKDLQAELAILKSEMVQLQGGDSNPVILDNTAIHGLL
nr:hypothetical protein CFP56_60042 [Quercus suber]